MNKTLAFGMVVAILIILVAVLAIPVVAHGPDDNEVAIPTEDALGEMREACYAGDYHGGDERGSEQPSEGWHHMGGHMTRIGMGHW